MVILLFCSLQKWKKRLKINRVKSKLKDYLLHFEKNTTSMQSAVCTQFFDFENRLKIFRARAPKLINLRFKFYYVILGEIWGKIRSTYCWMLPFHLEFQVIWTRIDYCLQCTAKQISDRSISSWIKPSNDECLSVDLWFFTRFWLFLHGGNIKLFCTSKSQNKNSSVFLCHKAWYIFRNQQFHVKSWLTYRSYSSVWWKLSCIFFFLFNVLKLFLPYYCVFSGKPNNVITNWFE